MRFFQYFKQSLKLFNKHRILPEYITFFVTNKCNARCKHCFYWKELNSKIDELRLDEIEEITKSMGDFLFLILTGGEPFTRKDLAEVAEIFYRNNHVRKMNIITNGILTVKIIKTMEKIKKHCPELYISLFVSLDDINEKHDIIRDVKGAYKKAIETIKHLKNLQENYKNLSIGIAMTYSSFNQDKIINNYEYIKKKIKPDMINCSFVRGDTKNKIAKSCRIDNYVKLQENIKKDLINRKVKGVYDPLLARFVDASKFEYVEQLIKTVKENRYIMPCYAGKINAVIYPNGDVHPCEILNKKMGNLREYKYNFRKLWFSKNSTRIRQEIKKSRCYCTHECNMLSNIIFDFRFSFKIFLNYLKFLFGIK
ncbi:MAG: radical SAM protein [Nanoarchaeota archaeon]|nr:radical SAM protein [Nanoarchaeota archaeon]